MGILILFFLNGISVVVMQIIIITYYYFFFTDAVYVIIQPTRQIAATEMVHSSTG